MLALSTLQLVLLLVDAVVKSLSQLGHLEVVKVQTCFCRLVRPLAWQTLALFVLVAAVPIKPLLVTSASRLLPAKALAQFRLQLAKPRTVILVIFILQPVMH